MKNIIETLMERDNITREQALEEVNLVKEMLQEAIDEGEETATLEEILMDELGLEPDYLFELL